MFPVNPRSRLTWLIKKAIKGPPSEIWERQVGWRRTEAKERERRLNGEKGREWGKYGAAVMLWSLLCQTSFIDSWMGSVNAFSFFFLVTSVTAWSFSNLHLQTTITWGSIWENKWCFYKKKAVHIYNILVMECIFFCFSGAHNQWYNLQSSGVSGLHQTPSHWQPCWGWSGLTLCNLPHIPSFNPEPSSSLCFLGDDTGLTSSMWCKAHLFPLLFCVQSHLEIAPLNVVS